MGDSVKERKLRLFFELCDTNSSLQKIGVYEKMKKSGLTITLLIRNVDHALCALQQFLKINLRKSKGYDVDDLLSRKTQNEKSERCCWKTTNFLACKRVEIQCLAMLYRLV